MKDVKIERYDFCRDVGFMEGEDGSWVRYEEIEKIVTGLQSQIESLNTPKHETVEEWVKPFEMSWDKWNIDLSEIENGTMKIFKVSEMSTSNNYTCWDKDRNEYHTRECLTLSEKLSKIIDHNGKPEIEE